MTSLILAAFALPSSFSFSQYWPLQPLGNFIPLDGHRSQVEAEAAGLGASEWTKRKEGEAAAAANQFRGTFFGRSSGSSDVPFDFAFVCLRLKHNRWIIWILWLIQLSPLWSTKGSWKKEGGRKGWGGVLGSITAGSELLLNGPAFCNEWIRKFD